MPTLSLSTADGRVQLALPVSGRTLDLLVAQLERLKQTSELGAFAGRVGARLDDVIPASVEPGLRNPTKAQIAVATRISSELGIALTPEILRYQEAMDAFLAAHVDKLSVRTRSAANTRRRTPPSSFAFK